MYKDVYTMPGYCTNCDYRGDIEIHKGQRAPKPPELFDFHLGRSTRSMS